MKTLRKTGLAAALGVLLSLGAAMAGNNDWHYDRSLDGTWQFVMTVRFDAPDCTTAPVIPFGPNPFPGLISYHEGGTLNEFASRSSPSIRSTGFGAWERTGKNKYVARYTFMEFDAEGALWRTMVIRSEIKLDRKGENYTAVNRLELTDHNSGSVMKICGTVEGARFEA